MIKYQRFVYIFIAVVFTFVVFHFLVWEFATKSILDLPKGHQVGDLARLAYDVSLAEIKPLEVLTLPKKHTLLSKINPSKIDALTFGDSFSKGGGAGLNPYFQDYMATYNDMNVSHVHDYKNHHFSCVQTLLVMINSGYIDEIKPKYVVLESAEKYCVKRLGVPLDFDLSDKLSNVKKYYQSFAPKPINGQNFKKLKFINSGNINYILYNFLYNFDDNAFVSKVYRLKTHEKPFVRGYSLVYKDELKSAQGVSQQQVKIVHKNLNKIADMLAEKGVKLYFMPVVDKYNLYYDFYEDNKYPKNSFFELLRPMQKNYKLIDTEAILTDKLKKDHYDLFFEDDTHWTHKASEFVFKEVEFD